MPVSQMGNYQEYLKRMPSPLREVESTPVRQHMFGNPFKIDKVFILLLETIIFFSFELYFVFEGVWDGVQKTCITLYKKNLTTSVVLCTSTLCLLFGKQLIAELTSKIFPGLELT